MPDFHSATIPLVETLLAKTGASQAGTEQHDTPMRMITISIDPESGT